MRIDKRNEILNQLSVLQNNIEDRWQNMTNKQVSELEEQIEKLWGTVCRRKHGR